MKTRLGRVTAWVPATKPGAKGSNVLVGAIFTEPDSGDRPDRIAIKIDSLPIQGWEGWLNVVYENEVPTRTPHSTRPDRQFVDDGEPF